MALVKVAIRSASSRLQSGRRSHNLIYLVRFDTVDAGNGYVALTASFEGKSIPTIGALHESNDGSVCMSISADPIGTKATMKEFEVKVEFGQPDTAELAALDDPLSRPAEISYDDEGQTEEYFRDTSTDFPHPSGRPVTNSAGEPFDTNPVRESARMVITVVKNEMFFDPVQAGAYANAINADPVAIDGYMYPSYCLKMSPITATKNRELVQGTLFTYSRTTYRMKFKANTWRESIDDFGYQEINGSNQRVDIIGDTGSPVSKPWPLDGVGHAKANSGDEPATLVFKPYPELTFSVFAFV